MRKCGGGELKGQEASWYLLKDVCNLYGPDIARQFQFLQNRQNMRKPEITLKEFLSLAKCNENIIQNRRLQKILGTKTVQSFYRK